MKPIVVLSNPKQQCATFFWTDRPEFYIGYRFMEHLPESQDSPLVNIDNLPRSSWGNMPETSKSLLSSKDGDPWIKNWLILYTENECNDEKQLSFKSFKDGSAWAKSFDNQRAQQREFYFKPVSDGVLVWMKLTTREPIPGAFCVQQCLRFTGCTNKEWRRQISNIPFLSEFDTQTKGMPHQTLTFVRKSKDWLQFPLANHSYHTLSGLAILKDKSAGEIAHGLIVRESLDKKFAAGMYWERTAFVSNRHPADCVHASVDFGSLEAGDSRVIHGKVYFLEGTKDDLLATWRNDFPLNNSD